jgi:MFS family permease
LPSVVGTAAALTLPRLAVPARRIRMLIAGLSLAACAVLLIAFADGLLLALGLVLQGVARGAMIPIAMLILMETDEVDSQVMGAAGGLFFTAAEIGGVLGPMMTGWLAEATGGFATGLVVLAGVCAACAFLVRRLAPVLPATR